MLYSYCLRLCTVFLVLSVINSPLYGESLETKYLALENLVHKLIGKIEKLEHDISKFKAVISSGSSASGNVLMERNQEEADALLNGAMDLLQDGNYEQAQISLQKYVDEYSEFNQIPKVLYWLGELYILQTEYEKAAQSFGQSYQYYKQWREKKKDYEFNKAPHILLKLGLCFKSLNKNNDAIITLERIGIDFPKAPIMVQEIAQKTLNELQP